MRQPFLPWRWRLLLNPSNSSRTDWSVSAPDYRDNAEQAAIAIVLSPISCRGEGLLHAGYSHAAFTDGRGAAFNRAGADVAGCKDSRKTSFKRSWLSFASMPRRCFSHVRTGLDESFVISFDLCGQPLRAWAGADHRKHGRRPNDSALACLGIFQFDLFQLFSAEHFADLRVVENLDVFTGLHPTRKIVRHLVANVVSPNEKEYFGRAVGKEHRCLAG